MFARIHALFLFLATIAVLAAATTPTTPTTATTTVTVTVTPPAVTSGAPANQCNTGSLNCCNSLERADDTLLGILLGLLGVVIQGVEALVGIDCSPIDILGIGQNSCNEQPVCCENNTFNGLIAIGCVPININL